MIFGTGPLSSEVTKYFNHRKLKFEFYCVTKRRTVPVPNIKEFDEIKDEIDDSFGIIVAMNNGDIAIAHLRSRNVVDHVFYSKEFLFYVHLWKSRQSSERVVFEDDSIKNIGNYKLREDTFYIVCPHRIGETANAASLVNAFKKQNHIDRVCLIVKNAHGDIPDLFRSVDDKLVSDELVEICLGFSSFNEIRKCRNYLFCSPVKPDFLQDQEYINKHFISRYKSLMCVGERSELEKIESKKIFMKSSQKSVILMPHAHSALRLSNSFWEKLASILAENGYAVYTNIADETEYVIEGTQALYKPLADMPAFAEGCSFVIALRSGLCDLLALTKTKMVIINTGGLRSKVWDLEVVSDKIKNVSLDPQWDDEENLTMLLRNAGISDITI